MDDYVESDASIAAAQPRPRVAPPAGMAARLGQVLAWTANTIAVMDMMGFIKEPRFRRQVPATSYSEAGKVVARAASSLRVTPLWISESDSCNVPHRISHQSVASTMVARCIGSGRKPQKERSTADERR